MEDSLCATVDTQMSKIKSVIKRMGGDDVDVVITEIGGTVGDIESLPHPNFGNVARSQTLRQGMRPRSVSLPKNVGSSK